MWRSCRPLMEDSPLPAPRPSTGAIHDDQLTEPRPRVGKSVLQFRELGKVKTEMEQLKIVKPPFVFQPMIEEKQEEEEEELDECFFDAVNNLGLASPAPPAPRPTTTAALPPSSGLPSSQDFPSSPGLPSSPNFSKGHLPSIPTSSPDLPSSPNLPFSPTSSPTLSQKLSSSPASAASLPPPQAPVSPRSPRELSDLRMLPKAKPSLESMPLPPRPFLPKVLLDSTSSSPSKTPSTPRRHKLLPMKILSNMLDTAVDSASTVDIDTPTKAVTFTEVHRSGPSRQQVNPRSANKVSSTRRSLASCPLATVNRPFFPLAKSCTLALPPSTLALPSATPSSTLSQGAGEAVPPPLSPPSTPRRHKLVPMKHQETMLDMPVDAASTATMDTPTKAVTFTEVHRSGPIRQQVPSSRLPLPVSSRAKKPAGS